MGKEEGVINVFPVEETIIDPLYEPLKLHRYELCQNLQRLKDVSHLRYGFSPYLLFDVCGMMEVIREIERRPLFTLEDTDKVATIKEELNKENGKLEKLKEEFKRNNHSLANPAKEKGDRGWVITDKSKKFHLLEENGYLNIYREKGEAERVSDKFLEKLSEYLKELGSKEKREDLNTLYGNLRTCGDIIKGIYDEIKGMYGEILNNFLYPGEQFEAKNFAQIAHLFRLEYPHKVICPICGEEQYMCEEGKIYSMVEALLRTFELRRARWLYMSGSLHTVHRAATHTRLSHEIGSMIVAVNALRVIEVYPYGDMRMLLGEYLMMRGELHEFLMANFLHDIGHSPLSHVLEPNPFIKLDHEKITRNLILGRPDNEGEADWYNTERYLLKTKVIKNFEYRFLKNWYDPIYNVGKGLEVEGEAKFFNFLNENKEIQESEIITVREVLENFGLDKELVVGILSRNKDKGGHEQDTRKIYDIQFLNKLIDSEIDLDRMDHVKRDSLVCGLSLISFRLLELLGSMSIVLPESKAKEEIHAKEDKPYIFISKDGLLYVMNLLTARKSVFKDILFSDENNWINGVVNQITALAVRYLPHLRNMLPFITDQILMHFYTNDLFLGTQIEKLNKLFHGKSDYSAYVKPMRYKLKDWVIVTEQNLRKMYEVIEGINDDPRYEKLELPAVVFYTNIKPTKCPVCGKRELKMVNTSTYNCADCKSKIEEIDRVRKITINEEKKNNHSIENRMLDTYGEVMHLFSWDNVPGNDSERVLRFLVVAFDIGWAKNAEIHKSGGGKTISIIKDKNSVKIIRDDKKKKVTLTISDGRTHDLKVKKEKGKLNIYQVIDGKEYIYEVKKKMVWDDILVYGKKFALKEDNENLKYVYVKFGELVTKPLETSREIFPKRPSELDVKNLFYVWISDFAITDERNESNGYKSKMEWVDEIKEEIGGILVGNKKEGESEEDKKGRIDEFNRRFVNLNEFKEVY